jgi:hypothetical protein
MVTHNIGFFGNFGFKPPYELKMTVLSSHGDVCATRDAAGERGLFGSERGLLELLRRRVGLAAMTPLRTPPRSLSPTTLPSSIFCSAVIVVVVAAPAP